MSETAAQPDQGEGRKPFAAFVQEQRGGGLHGELSEMLCELVLATLETGRAGSLALTVKVTPNRDGQTVTVTDKTKLSLPEGERGAAIFFVDENGNLSRKNPAQTELPLRGVRNVQVDVVTGEINEEGTG